MNNSEDNSSLSIARQTFSEFLRHYEYALADDMQSVRGKVAYNFDFSLLYPYTFRAGRTNNQNFDSVGRNIFSLLYQYPQSTGFVPSISLPSTVEFLDVLAHRVDRLEKYAKSPDRLRDTVSAFRSIVRDRNGINSNAMQHVRSVVAGLNITSSNEGISRFLEMYNSRTINLLDESIIHDIHKSKFFKDIFDDVLENMSSKRGKDDPRSYEDRMFHYRVDAWNIAVAVCSTKEQDIEINHVTRGGISKFLPIEERGVVARNPFVPFVKMVALAKVPIGENLQDNSHDFMEVACRNIGESVKILESAKSTSDIRWFKQQEIDEIYNKYIRVMYRDYEFDRDGRNLEEVEGNIKDFEVSKYASIFTEKGLKERFHADVEAIKKTAREVGGVTSDQIDERLLSDYGLDNNPRVAEIRKKLAL